MKKFTTYGWIVALVIASLALALLFYFYNNFNARMADIKEAVINLGISVENIQRSQQLSIWYQSCPDAVNIDWEIAINALSQHFSNLAKQTPGEDYFGPAEIERHFAENCEEDLKIYNNYVTINEK